MVAGAYSTRLHAAAWLLYLAHAAVRRYKEENKHRELSKLKHR